MPRNDLCGASSLGRLLALVGGVSLGGLLAVASSARAAADPLAPVAGRKLAIDGTSTGVPACGDCHGVAGGGKKAAPRLAGLDAAYLRDQLVAYAQGTRADTSMANIARRMDAKAMSDAAAYFARLPVPPAEAPAVTPDPLGAAGAVLALRGDWGHDIPPCALCHGAAGGGTGAAFPAIADQPAAYSTNQLMAWKSGKRHDDPQGMMRTVAMRLDDDQVAAVAAYYAMPAGSGPVPRPRIPDDELGAMVKLGEAIFRDPSVHAVAYVGNALSCENCHIDAGRRGDSGPMGAAWIEYPAFRKKNGHVNTFAERLQECFTYSMNGKAPPLGDKVLVALESYANDLAKGAPTGRSLPGRGYPKLMPPKQGFDFVRGATVFTAKCAICHGADGLGQKAAGRTVFPPLWGPASFNWGAGMSSIDKAAGFIKANMPLGQGFSLTDQQAWDVAAFVDGHERPQDPRFAGNVATTRGLYHNEPTSLYGKRVNGSVLGEHALPLGSGSPRATK